MSRVVVVLAVALIWIAPTEASEPGQPLDCSDWVFLEPGFSCSVRIDCGVQLDSSLPQECGSTGVVVVYDNAGGLLRMFNRGAEFCGNRQLVRHELTLHDGSERRVLGYVEDRCLTTEPVRLDSIVGLSLSFDSTNGRLAVSTRSRCLEDCPDYLNQYRIIEIAGFAPLFETLESYIPEANVITFRVPTHPEGLLYADFFDTYYGRLSTVGDWSQAQPLQCGYPASAPSVGDYLTVEDTLPTPPPGGGRYYVTAATYMGQTRYGRKSIGGVLAGRDPAVLPACE